MSSMTTPNCKPRSPITSQRAQSWAPSLIAHALKLTPTPPLVVAYPSWSPTTTTLVPVSSTLPLENLSRPPALVPPILPPIPVPTLAPLTVLLLAPSLSSQTPIVLLSPPPPPPTIPVASAGVARALVLATSWQRSAPTRVVSVR